jgi:hypothetical protein
MPQKYIYGDRTHLISILNVTTFRELIGISLVLTAAKTMSHLISVENNEKYWDMLGHCCMVYRNTVRFVLYWKFHKRIITFFSLASLELGEWGHGEYKDLRLEKIKRLNARLNSCVMVQWSFEKGSVGVADVNVCR